MHEQTVCLNPKPELQVCCYRYVCTTNSKIKAAATELEGMEEGVLNPDVCTTDKWNWELLIGQRGAGNESKIPAKELPILRDWMQSDIRKIWNKEMPMPETWTKQIQEVLQYEEGEDVLLTYSKPGTGGEQ